MTLEQRNSIVRQMIALAHGMTSASDLKHATKVERERLYWDDKINTRKAQFEALILRLFPTYTGTVEEFMAANVKLLAQSVW